MRLSESASPLAREMRAELDGEPTRSSTGFDEQEQAVVLRFLERLTGLYEQQVEAPDWPGLRAGRFALEVSTELSECAARSALPGSGRPHDDPRMLRRHRRTRLRGRIRCHDALAPRH